VFIVIFVHVDAVTAGFLGTVLGATVGTVGTLITKYFDERKARREVIQKTAFEYWQTTFQAALTKGPPEVPFEAFFLHAVQIMELAERKDLAQDEFIAELNKARARHDARVSEWIHTRGPKIS
jgi:hypothetical protein